MKIIEAFSMAGLIFLVALIGYMYARHEAAAAIALAHSDTRACLDAKGADAVALESIGNRLTNWRALIETLAEQAERLLSGRDAEVKGLAEQAGETVRRIQESPRDDDACAALADMPVCPAVAAGLWPLAQETTSHQPAKRD